MNTTTTSSSPLAMAPTPVALPSPRERPDILRRFTLDGSKELEHRLAVVCERIRAALCGLFPAGKLEALLLGGGYGRGEGGVLSTPEGDRPYNDLEFYVFLRGNRHLNEMRYHRALDVLGHILTPQIGIEVEFKIASLDEFVRSPVSMFSYDLVTGHRLLVGREELLDDCGHHMIATNIPLSECSRLLMNRCSGLLFARELLEKTDSSFTTADADFIRRNIAKASLALGDAVLTARGGYHWSCRERHHRLMELSPEPSLRCLEQLRHHHKVGVAFKLHPERYAGSRAQLKRHHYSVTTLAKHIWLWIESQRLNTAFSSIQDYVEDPVDKYPEASPIRNSLVNLKVLGPGRTLRCPITRHPRERVLNSLSLMLWEPEAFVSAHWRQRLQRELCTDAPDFPGMLSAYRKLWARVN